ncbi:MAG: imidazole glycerol phosphate synthase subunit HisH [Candidatus Melainabacteria bacterium]|nr:imidazole glycerol phosphate synthase subunit HisH [Candidatus Melainabacteria bacterium]
MKDIVIIDYKRGGNLFSVNNSLEAIGASTQISSDPVVIAQASKILFPGVGSFGIAMQSLAELGLDQVIKDKIAQECPVLAICVGMQALFQGSTEDQSASGLGIIPAQVTRFSESHGLKIPHMGWNSVHNHNPQNPLFKGIPEDSQFYFVHSYRAQKQELEGYSTATTDYGDEFISHIWNGRSLFACQFHPEKSAENGLKLLNNFLKL